MEENVIQINGIMQNVDVNAKKRHVCEKNYVQNPATCSCENGKQQVLWMIQQLDLMNIQSYTMNMQILMIRKPLAKRKISIFYLHFH